VDHQVKIRGFRVEPGEIEAVLGGHPGVSECLVLAREDEPGRKRLVAYVVPSAVLQRSDAEGEDEHEDEDDLTTSPPHHLFASDANLTTLLRAYLAERLPDYLVPSAFVVMEAFPLTANGKVDRAALPTPCEAAYGDEGSFVAPRTPVEEKLSRLWGELLGMGRVGVHDRFFALGGHSLLATQMLSRVYARFGVELPLRVLFETPTIEGLAQAIAAAKPEGDQVDALLAELEGLSEEQVEALLAQEEQSEA
jgi:acyl carrier protein